MTIGKAFREIQAAKRKAELEIQKARWEHPLVARPTAQPEDPSKHHHAKTRARHDSIMTKTIGAEEQFDLKSTPQSVIDEVSKILNKDKPKKKSKKKEHPNVHIHSIHGDDKVDTRRDPETEPYTDHSFKEAVSGALGTFAGPINTTPNSTRTNPSNKIRRGFGEIKKGVDKKRENLNQIKNYLKTSKATKKGGNRGMPSPMRGKSKVWRRARPSSPK